MIDKKQLKYDKAYLKMASEWAKLSYCKRRQVGAGRTDTGVQTCALPIFNWMVGWMCHFHNDVNARLEKPLHVCNNVLKGDL